MSFLSRGLFVVVGIIAGTSAISYFVLGNTADFGLPDGRLGAWREAKVRPACYGATEAPEKDRLGPKLPAEQHRIDVTDFVRARELTAALHCYLVTQGHAVCEPNNRAYIVDYIGKYFGKQDSMLATATRYGTDEVRLVRQMWDSTRNREILGALNNHLRNGRLVKSDFGWSAPAALNDQFARYQNVADACGKERPWVAVKL